MAHYFDPNGPISWDMAMEVTPPDWKVAVNRGDKLRVTATYDTERASWYESMGIVVALMADDQQGAADPFGGHFATRGQVTHGQLKEATHYGGDPVAGAADPRTLPDGQTLEDRVGIANFAYLPGPNPPAIQPGGSLDFGNLDASASILHTVTACRAPCNRSTGVSYPLADGPVDFDSGQLGYGPSGYTAATNRGEWQTPKTLPPGTYTYFCRVHPFMRGSFRVLGKAAGESGAPAASHTPARARVRGGRVRVRRGVARVRVACARGGATCRGRLVARWRGRVVATGRYAVPAGRRALVRLSLTRAGRSALRRHGSLRVRLGGASVRLLMR